MLKHVNFTITDDHDDNGLNEPDMAEIIDLEHEGSFTVLVACLESCVDTLTILCITTDDWDAYWVISSLPSDGFTLFKTLKELELSYQCLFGRARDRWSHISITPAMIFPPCLEKLFVSGPKLAFLDWLARLPLYRDEVPHLRLVRLTCATVYGDGYNLFAFESYPHRAGTALESLDIKFEMKYRIVDWQDDWANYELEVVGLSSWQISFGAAIPGERSKCEPNHYNTS